MNPEWMDILNKVKAGSISPEEAAQLLGDENTLSSDAPSIAQSVQPASAGAQPPEYDFHPDIGWWKDAWLVPFWVGTAILTLGAVGLGLAYSRSPGFWVFCSWSVLLFGLVILFLGWWSRQARWVHVRVQDAGGSKVSISLPLPLRLASWVLRTFGSLIPQIREQHLENLPDILDVLGEEKGPLSVEVDEEDGDRVRVYIL